MSSTGRSPNAGVFSSCPHCGADLEDVTLPEHICRGQCSGPRPDSIAPPHSKWAYVPALEDAPDTIDVDEGELEERRALADRLEERDVW